MARGRSPRAGAPDAADPRPSGDSDSDRRQSGRADATHTAYAVPVGEARVAYARPGMPAAMATTRTTVGVDRLKRLPLPRSTRAWALEAEAHGAEVCGRDLSGC
jgi:hypothetical protein